MPMYTNATIFQTEARKKEEGACISIPYILLNAVCIRVCIYLSGTGIPHGNLGMRNSDLCLPGGLG